MRFYSESSVWSCVRASTLVGVLAMTAVDAQQSDAQNTDVQNTGAAKIGSQFVHGDEPLSPDQAARTMRVPEGFRVTLFAGEPDVMQPIGFCIDDRGRLWVAEAYNYPITWHEAG